MPAAVGIGLGLTALSGYSASRNQRNMFNRAYDQALMPRSTQYGSYVSPGEGISFIDPRIRAMREKALQNLPLMRSQLESQIGSTVGGLEKSKGNLQGIYEQYDPNTFVNPLMQRLAMRRGELSTSLGSRDLGGSSFYSQGLGNLESAAAPGIAAARSQGLAGQAALTGQIADLDQQILAARSSGTAKLQNLDNLYASIAGQNLQQELAALGLSQADIGAIIGASQQAGQFAQNQNQMFGNLLYGLGGLYGGGYTSPQYSPMGYGGAAYGGTPYWAP